MLCVLVLPALLAPAPGQAVDGHPAVDVSGWVRFRFDDPRGQPNSTLYQAQQLGLPGADAAPALRTLNEEVKLVAGPVAASATFTQSKVGADAWSGYARFNELNASGSVLGWYYTVGRKIVSWDVGWGFRPNDLIQQEARMRLTDNTLQGRPLLMAEKFDGDAALSLVAVNPTRAARSLGGDEPALAGRYFRHAGPVDLYGFVRWGERTHASVGASLSWVATDNTEWHASWNSAQALDTLCVEVPQGLVEESPARNCTVGRRQRVLLGNTWSSANNVNLITEWWWDGGAPSPATWRDWTDRNRLLSRMAPPPGAGRMPLAGNLAWQSDALLQTNLHRSNFLVSFNWGYDGYAISVYQLWHPADAGRISTATVGWASGAWDWNVGARWYGGPRASVTAQLPTRNQVYVEASWRF